MTTTGLARLGARGGAVTVLGQVQMVAVRMIALVVLARMIDPALFGVVAVVAAIATFGVSIVLFGLPMAVAQAGTVSRPTSSSLFLVNSGLGLVLGAALFWSGDWLASVYGDERIVEVARWLALVPVMSGLAAQFRAHLMRSMRFGTLVATDSIGLVAGMGLATWLASRGADLDAVVAQQLAPVAFQATLVIVTARWRPGRPGGLAEARGLLAVGSRILGMNVLKNGSRNAIVPVLGLSVPSAALGNFDRAQQLIVTPINLTVDRTQQVAVPVLSKLREQPDRMRAFMRRGQLCSAYLVATGFLVVAALGDPLVRLLLGPGWAIAGTVIQILAVGAVFRVLGQMSQWVFIAAGATRHGLRFNLWTQPAVVAITLTGIPFGITGAAVMNSVAWGLFWPVAAVTAARVTGGSAGTFLAGPARGIALFGVPVAAAAALARLADLNAPVTVLAGVGLAGCAGLVSWLVFPAVRADLRDLVATLRLVRSGGG